MSERKPALTAKEWAEWNAAVEWLQLVAESFDSYAFIPGRDIAEDAPSAARRCRAIAAKLAALLPPAP